MLGAIIGDIVGSPYEFDCNNIKTTEFPFWGARTHFTDDTVMTVAVADALLRSHTNGHPFEDMLIKAMRRFGRMYPGAGYGARFQSWLVSPNPRPYNSWGNGSAMRVSPIGWVCDTLDDTLELAERSAAVTHDHPEGIKGAQVTAAAIFLARTGASKDQIRLEIQGRFGYDLDRTLNQIRPGYHHVESCQESVPEAIIAFLESCGFEDAIRKAISIGGDSDTIAAICGGIAEAYYGLSAEMKAEALSRLDVPLREVLETWHEQLPEIQEDGVIP